MAVRIGVTAGRATTPGPAAPADKATLDFWKAVLATGATPIVLTPDTPGMPAEILAGLDGLLLTGGEDIDPARYGEGPHPALGPLDPARDAFELALFALAWQTPGFPLLGVCRGMQLMNVGLGGTLWQDLPTQRPGGVAHRERDRLAERVHGLSLAPESRLGALLTPHEGVNSLHHQAVKDLAPGLVAVGWSPDGLVEAVEAPGEAFRCAVQWHPEILAPVDAPSQRLFAAFTAACRVDAPR